MRRTWIGVSLALAMVIALTGCRGRGTTDGVSANPAGSGALSSAEDSVISQDIGAADDRINGNVSGQNEPGSAGIQPETDNGTYTGRTSYMGKSDYKLRDRPEQRGVSNPFLQDGRYRAGDDGKVDGWVEPGVRDFTETARDMLRGTGKAVGNAAADLGRGVKNAARDVMNG